MPNIISQGAGSAQGFGFAARSAASGAGTYIEDVFSTYLYTGNGGSQTIMNNLALGSSNAGGSAFFDNSTDCYASVPCTAGSVLDLNSVDWTVECFVFFKAWNSLNNIFGASNVNNYFGPRSTGTNIEYQPGSGAQFNFACSLSLNTWYHIALTKSGSSVRCFIAGTQVGSTATSTEAPFLVSASPLRLGAYANGGNNVNGFISNFRVTKGAALYTSNFTPPSSALTASGNTSLLTFQGTSQFADNSGNSLTITRVGTVAGSALGPFNSGTGVGGLVWLKSRSAATDHGLFDTSRGVGKGLRSNLSNAQFDLPLTTLTAFNSTGFSIGDNTTYNTGSATYASWAFCEQSKFFDVVTYTGTGAVRTISHNLGSAPGFIIIKRTDAADEWFCYHRSLSANNVIYLNLTNATNTAANMWNNTAPTSTVFTVGTDTGVNGSGRTYVAYLFAHDAGGFGASGTDNVITCGSYVGNSSTTGPTVTLGYEPQWILVKNITTAGSDWFVFDNMRGLAVNASNYLRPNTADAEIASSAWITPTPTGFYPSISVSSINASGNTYIYMAIRRGPMRTPTSGTSVFAPSLYRSGVAADTVITTGFNPDAVLPFRPSSNKFWTTRLLGNTGYLESNSTAAFTGISLVNYTSSSNSFVNAYAGIGAVIFYSFGRAPGFFDISCYTGTGSAGLTVSHNLSAVPELIIVKRRSAAEEWAVYSAPLGATKGLEFNSAGQNTNIVYWNNTAPTASQFTLGTYAAVNASASTYVAYLFSTVSGVSKIGSYTGTGTTNQINCGFTGGARFVLIKRADSTGDWYVWDSARGIVAGDDPYLLLNSTAAEVTNTDYVDTYSAGFEISSTAPAAINANGGTFIFLAIA